IECSNPNVSPTGNIRISYKKHKNYLINLENIVGELPVLRD
ncbi:16169_t:CDS:1, partial [Racocetra fulgida]